MATAIEEDKRAKRTGPAGFTPGVDVSAPLNLTPPGTMRPDAPKPVATQPAPQFVRTNAGPMLQPPPAPAPVVPQAPNLEQQQLANQTAMYVQGAQAAAAQRPAPVAAGMNPAVGASIAAAVDNPQPSLNATIDTSPRLFNPANARPMAQAAQSAPVAPVVTPPVQPAAVAAPAGPVRAGDLGWRTAAVRDGAFQDATAAWNRGEVAQAAGTAVRGVATAIPTSLYEAGEAALSPVIGGARGFVRGLFGGEEAAPAAAQAPAAPPAAAPAPRVAAAPAPVPAAPTAATATKPANNTPVAAPAPLDPAPAAGSNGFTEVAPGILRKGNTFTDQAGTQDAGFLNRGAITPQNQAAADALAANYNTNQQALARLEANNAPAQARGFAPRQFDRAASISALNDLRSPEAIALRNLRIAAEQESEAARTAGRAWKGGAPAAEAYAALMSELTKGTREGQQAEMRNETELTGIGMREAGATTRAAMGEAGATGRAQMTNDLQQSELGLKREAQGFTSRAAARLEKAQADYMAADTPEKKAAAAKVIRELQGKEKAGTWKGIALQGGTDALGNRTEGVLAAVNDETGEMRQFGGASANKSAGPSQKDRPVGTVSVVDGKSAVWDGNKWVPQ